MNLIFGEYQIYAKILKLNSKENYQMLLKN